MNWNRQKALSGAIFSGAWINLGSPVSVEISGRAGFDWLLLDLEHGSTGIAGLSDQILALQGSGTAAIVRVPEISAPLFKTVFDLGAGGIMVPHVESVEDAERIVRFSRIPPLGMRGVAASTRSSGYGFSYEDYLKDANSNLLIMAQIESRKGIAKAHDIAAVDGIDVLFTGPLDLSVDLGTGVDLKNAEFSGALKSVVAAAHKNGKAAGILARDAEQARAYAGLGYTVITLGSDRGLIASGMKKNAAALAALADAVPKT